MQTDAKYAVIENDVLTTQNIIYLIDRMSEVIIENEVPFCDMDAHGGDGDFGMSIAKGFRRLKVEWEDILKKSGNIGEFLDACAVIIMEYCGGASGPIWGFAFRYAAKAASDSAKVDIRGFAELIQAAVEGVQETGKRSFGQGAVVGDKTLVDALVPCANSWKESAQKGIGFLEGFKQAAQEAVSGAEKTKDTVAHMGRAENAGERSLGYPDAVAYALGVIFTEIAKSVK